MSTRYQFEVRNGEVNGYVWELGESRLRDGWYSGTDGKYTGPFGDKATAEYVSGLLEAFDNLSYYRETGPRQDAFEDLMDHIMSRVEDLTIGE